MSDGSSEDDYPAMTVAPDGRIWVAWVAYENGKDVIKIRSSADGESWSPIETVSEAPGDYYQVALASSGNGKVTAVWSAIVNGTGRSLCARLRERPLGRPVEVDRRPRPEYVSAARRGAGRQAVSGLAVGGGRAIPTSR